MIRLTRADAEMGFPQFNQNNLARENYSKDFYADNYFLNSTGGTTGKALIKQIEEQSKTVVHLKTIRDDANSAYAAAKHKAEGGSCAQAHNNKGTRQICQNKADNLAQDRLTEFNAAQTRYNAAKAELETLKTQLASDQQAQQELAKIGETPESIATKAMQKAQSASAKSKWLLVGGVVAAVIVLGIVISKKVG